MKIVSTAYRTPSMKLDNDQLIDFIAAQNPDVPQADKDHYLKMVKRLLTTSGADTRYWRDPNGTETANELIMGAMQDALTEANMAPSDIDLVIYCGVGKGFTEPANAYFYANATGMSTANCFDITDACMSWIRALNVSYLMLQSGQFKNAIIINGEFHFDYHLNLDIGDIRSLEYNFPNYTIGEAATATIVSASDHTWQFDYSSDPRQASLCTIPMAGHEDFVGENERIGLNGLNGFVSFGKDLFDWATIALGELIQKSIDDPNSKKLYFPHAPSRALYEEGMPRYGIDIDKVYLRVYTEFGNLVSASIPVALKLAIEENALQRGDEVAFVPASAGAVAATVQLTY